jgi:hypothetical protein
MTVVPSPNRVYQTSSSTGTGTLSLDGSPPAGMHSFVDGYGSGKTIPAYTIVDGAGNVEINSGVVTSGSPDTLTRNSTPIWSTNIVGGAYARVNFPAGPLTIFTSPVAELSGLPVGWAPADATGDGISITPARAIICKVWKLVFVELSATISSNSGPNNLLIGGLIDNVGAGGVGRPGYGISAGVGAFTVIGLQNTKTFRFLRSNAVPYKNSEFSNVSFDINFCYTTD